MRDNWWCLLDINGESPFILPMVPLLSHSCSNHLISQLNLFLDNSIYQFGFLDGPGRVTQEALHQASKLSGAVHIWFTGTSSSYLERHVWSVQHGPRPKNFQFPQQVEDTDITGLHNSRFSTGSLLKGDNFASGMIGKVSSFLTRLLSREADTIQSLPLLSLASILIPPFKNLSPEVLDGGPKNEGTKLHSFLDRGHNEIAYDGCSICSHPDLNGKKNAVELRTGIEFPMVLDDASIGGKKSNLAPEILVGTGSKTMEIFRLKSFKVYTFGFYVHRNSLCKKLGLKYASNQVCESDKWGNFYQDLLREDIGMTVRLVINYNGMRTNTVRDVFEKSLRARLQKTNPNTDYSCLKAFGSLFVKDIPLPAGTTVDIRRTADGCLITEIEGNHIGSVQSKELCRAFFDMYLGDVPVSKETKEDIGKNVASIIRKC